MGFKDLPGGQNDKAGQKRADFAKEMSPKPQKPHKDK